MISPNDAVRLKDIPLEEARLTRDQVVVLHSAGRTDFKGVDFTEVSFCGLDFSRELNLSGAILTNIDLTGVVLSEGSLIGTKLSGNQVDQLYNTGLRNFNGVNLQGESLTREQVIRLRETGFTNFVNVNLSGVDLSGINFSGVNLSGANLAGTTLNNTTFDDTTVLTNTKFIDGYMFYPHISLSVINMLIKNPSIVSPANTTDFVNHQVIGEFIGRYKEDLGMKSFFGLRKTFDKDLQRAPRPMQGLVLMQHFLEKENTRTRKVLGDMGLHMPAA